LALLNQKENVVLSCALFYGTDEVTLV
jgi:hypothetical protein